jgi:hypothetical protein
LRQTSGALRQSEGSGVRAARGRSEKACGLKRLSRMARQTARMRAKSRVLTATCAASTTARRANRSTGRRKIPNQANGLSRAAGISPKSNINCADESCGKLVAKQLAQIFVAAKR